MSEPEKKSGVTPGTSVVLVEQTTASRHKQPFRPIDMQEDVSQDLHQKRSRAPAVPSVAEEMKGNVTPVNKDRKDTVSPEKHKQSIAKKLSMITKKRSTSPEAVITLAPITVDTKKGTITPPPQPIPAQVTSAAADDLGAKALLGEKKDEDDSIADEITELRTTEAAKNTSEWPKEPANIKKKGVSWHEEEYLSKVKLQNLDAKSRVCVLERKSSLGPCFRATAPFGRPSGISLCVAKSSIQPADVPMEYQPKHSVINISISKKCLVNKVNYGVESVRANEQTKQIQNRDNFFGAFRQKVANMSDRIKNTLL